MEEELRLCPSPATELEEQVTSGPRLRQQEITFHMVNSSVATTVSQDERKATSTKRRGPEGGARAQAVLSHILHADMSEVLDHMTTVCFWDTLMGGPCIKHGVCT